MSDIMLSVPLWGVFLLSLVPLTLKLFNKNKEPHVAIVSGVSILGLILCAISITYHLSEEALFLFSSFLMLDPFRAWISLILIALTFFVILVSPFHPQVNQKHISEILFLYLNALVGLLVLTWSNNMLIAFIGLELASMAFYLLIALGCTGKIALTGAFKYFVLGSLAGIVMLFGIAFLSPVGHFDLSRLLHENYLMLEKSWILKCSVLFIFVGFLFKVSLFPFQFWLVDVYESSFTPLLVFMAGGMKLAVFTALFSWTKDTNGVLDFTFFLSSMQWIAVLSVFFGTLGALWQKDLRKMLIFSTIAHSGYLLMLLITSFNGADFASSALFYYLILYAMTTMGAFFCLFHLEKKDTVGVNLTLLKDVRNQNPLNNILITVFLLSLAGIPPTGGFVAKLFLFQNLIDRGFWWMLFWAILASACALVFYLKPLVFLFLEKHNPKTSLPPVKKSYFMLSINTLLALLVIWFGLFPKAIVSLF